MSLRTQYVDAGLKNVSLSNFHGVAVRNATIYGKYFPTHTGSKPPPPKRARSRSANLHLVIMSPRRAEPMNIVEPLVESGVPRDTIRETVPAFRVCRSTQRTGMGAYATSHAHAALCDGLLFAPRISGLE